MPASEVLAGAVIRGAVAPAGIVLAAGGGRRFGQPKAAVRFAGRLLVELAVEALQHGGCDPVIAVLGASAPDVMARARLDGVVVVTNPDWRKGIGASLRTGLTAAARAGAPAVVVVLVDQPLVGAQAVQRVAMAWTRGATVAVATYDDRPGHPVVLDRRVWPAARAGAVGDVGARALFAAQPHLVTRVACDDVGDPRDIDTPDDLTDLEVSVESARAKSSGA